MAIPSQSTGSLVRSPSPFDTYLGAIDRSPLLSAAEEKTLATRVLAGDAVARDRMVSSNLRLVVCIARGYTGRGLPIEDLVAEGNMGLLRAVEGFDPTMNTRFSTYGSFWIKQSIKRAIINTSKTIRVPAYMCELLAKWRKATNKLTDEYGCKPPPEEIGKFLGLSKKKIAIIKKAIEVANAGARADDGSGWGLEKSAADDRAEMPGAALVKMDDLDRVMGLLDKMDPRESAILRMRFGLGSEEPKTLGQIGDSLGLTRERVRQIEKEALAKLYDGVQ